MSRTTPRHAWAWPSSLSAWGFQTEVAANGEEAMEKVTTFRPAIIVSDLVMPRMGGLELLRTLKDQLSDLTLILFTAQGTVDSAVEAIKEGAYDYLSKPVDPSRLRILLQKAVERQETLREVQASAAPAARAGQLRPHHRQQPQHPQPSTASSNRRRRRARRC